jgi:hypothetical protein
MSARFALTFCILVTVVGCAGPSPQEKYTAAVELMNAEQARLDNLRPAYDAARKSAELAVFKEIAGATPDEATADALKQLETVAGGLTGAQGGETAGEGNANAADLDATIDRLITAQSAMLDQQAALAGSIGKANETMTKIQTPGTPENKRFEELLAAMPEVQAYRRQEVRLARAKEAVEKAEAALPGATEVNP